MSMKCWLLIIRDTLFLILIGAAAIATILLIVLISGCASNQPALESPLIPSEERIKTMTPDEVSVMQEGLEGMRKSLTCDWECY